MVSVDGSALDGLTVDGARDRIRGPKGSVVELAVRRGGGAPIQLTITRDVVQTKEVDEQVLADGTVGYIGLAGFSDAAADDVVAALKAHLAAGRTKLILDVRGNPGGYVTAARKIASQFIASGPVFWEQDAQGNQVATEALGDGVATAADVDVVVLIDGGSASASEIVAGALQDTERATARRPAVVRQGHRPAVAGAERRGRCLQADHRPLADPEQALDQRHRASRPMSSSPCPTPLPAGSDPTLDKALELLAGPSAHAGERAGRLTRWRRRASALLHSLHASSTVSENERR